MKYQDLIKTTTNFAVKNNHLLEINDLVKTVKVFVEGLTKLQLVMLATETKVKAPFKIHLHRKLVIDVILKNKKKYNKFFIKKYLN